MLTIDGKQFRNLEEQVRQNQSDIKYILEEEGVLNQFGIKVIGQVTSSSQLPDPNTYQGEYGDAYAVGTETPYELYIYTRQFSGQTSPSWFNIGQFPMPGPQGIQGPQGVQGIQGIQGSTWTTGPSVPTSTTGFRQYDMYLNSSTGEVYQYNGSTWQNVGSIKGPQGIQGIQGVRGPQGIQGPTGPQGIQGPAGDPFTIVGTLTNTDQLPTPTEDIREQAYLIEIDGLNHLYVIVGTTDLSWYDVGALEGVRGPQGPQGPQGIQGPANTLTIGTVTTLPTGQNATASITGTAPNQVLNLGIPRGLPGADGTAVSVAGSEVSTLSFTTDPQTQLNKKLDKSGGEVSGDVTINNSNGIVLEPSSAGQTYNAFKFYAQGDNVYVEKQKVEGGADYQKLLPLDSSLSTTSVNAVQNNVVTEALNTKANTTTSNIFTGNQTINGNLTVSGVVTSDLTVNGDVDINGNLNINGSGVVNPWYPVSITGTGTSYYNWYARKTPSGYAELLALSTSPNDTDLRTSLSLPSTVTINGESVNIAGWVTIPELNLFTSRSSFDNYTSVNKFYYSPLSFHVVPCYVNSEPILTRP